MRSLYKIGITGLMIFFITIRLFSQNLNNTDQGKIDFYLQSATEFESAGKYALAANYYNKMAYLFWQRNINDKAIESFTKSLDLNKKVGNNNAVQVIYYNMGMIYSEINQYDQAEKAIQKGIELSKQLGKTESIASGHLNLGMVQSNLKKFNDAIKNTNKALQLYLEAENNKLIRSCYGVLAETYEKMGNTEKMVEYFDMFAAIDKQIKRKQISEMEEKTQITISKVNAEKAITQQELDMQTSRLERTKDSLSMSKLEAEKQRIASQLSELKIKEKDAQLKSRRTLIYGLFGVVVIIFVFSGFLYMLFRDKKKANLLLDTQNRHIRASIKYAQRIQNAILPIKENMDKEFETFVIYRPKDIVSGDFYWYSKIQKNGTPEQHFISAVDCTGHGVPGAFMSMIGNTLLNEIVNEFKTYSPAKILETLNEEVRLSLKQDQTDNNDGMDVCLCKIEKVDPRSITITYSGAKRPLFYYNSKKNEIIVLEGDRKSIGGGSINRRDFTFTNQEITVSKGDIIYLTSDGIIDQNSVDRKRFGSKKFMELLKDCATYKMPKQQETIECALADHMGDAPQRDDITILGIKII